MQMLTIKADPKKLFGIAILITGLVVIILTFVGNHSGKAMPTMAGISCATTDERLGYIKSLGWECDDNEMQKNVIIPSEFNDVYQQYNDIQKQQGLKLEDYKGRQAVIYTYNIKNYDDNENVIADLVVCDNVLIAADLCDPSVDDGFLVGLTKNDKT